MAASNPVARHFTGKNPQLKAAYDRLLAALREIGPVREVSKQTSIHLEKNAGFAGVHPLKSSFNLEFRTDHPIEHPRITRRLQLSARRFEHTIKLTQPADVDKQLLAWLQEAYTLSK